MKDNLEKEFLDYLQKNKTATTDELASIFYTSASTVRRKLSDMQTKGLVTRTHGGVILNDVNNFLPSFSFRSHQNSLEKKKIALSAIKLIKNGNVIFLDGSTSAFFIAEYLTEFENIKVITNGIDTLSLLSKHNIRAYSTGGEISRTNRSVLVGHYAENTVEKIHADIFFFSANSLDANGEIYDYSERENALREKMMKQADKKVFLCDSTKLYNRATFKLCELCDVDYLVSNKDIRPYFKTEKLPEIIFE